VESVSDILLEENERGFILREFQTSDRSLSEVVDNVLKRPQYPSDKDLNQFMQ